MQIEPVTPKKWQIIGWVGATITAVLKLHLFNEQMNEQGVKNVKVPKEVSNSNGNPNDSKIYLNFTISKFKKCNE